MLKKQFSSSFIIVFSIIITIGGWIRVEPSPEIDKPLLSGNYLDGNITLIPKIDIELSAGTEVTFETRNCSTDADPVLHLMMDDIQVSANDNYDNGSNAHIEYRVTKSGVYQLLLRASNNHSSGECDIFFNDAILEPQIKFAGWHVGLQKYRQGEVMQTVPQPNGVGTHSVYFLHSNGVDITKVYNSNVAGVEFVPECPPDPLRMIIGAHSPDKVGSVLHNPEQTGH